MGFFGKILEKLGLKKDEPAAPVAAKPTPVTPAKPMPTTPAKPAATPSAVQPKMEKEKDDNDSIKTMEPAKPSVKAISEVDVVKQLEKLSEGSGLDWKVSIVDLLKILDIDSSKNARIELAKELSCPAEFIGGDYSKMNVWLHKTVLQKIAENGGNIPQTLLD